MAQEPTIFVEGVPPDVAVPSYPLSTFQEDELGLTSADPFEGIAKKLVDATGFVYDQWDMARQPFLADTKDVWDRYLNKWDFADKEDWQSQRSIPKVTMAVERLVATMSRLLTMSKKWFTVRALSPKKEPFINFCREWVEYQLNHPKVNFKRVLKQAIKVGLLANILAVNVTYETNGYPDPEHQTDGPEPEDNTLSGLLTNSLFESSSPLASKQDGFLRLEVLNPRKVLLDPTGRKRGVIIERHYTRAEFRHEAEQRNWINVEQVVEKAMADVEKMAREADEKITPYTLLKDDVLIWECMFDHLSDEDGEQAIPMRNFSYIIANKEFVVQEPIPNPFWHEDFNVITCGLIDVPFSVYHMSPVGISIQALETWVDFLNLIIDHYQQVVIGVKEINMGILHADEDSDSLLNLYPGRVFKKTNEQQLISNMVVQDISQAMIPFLSLLGNEIGEGTAMSETNKGAQPRRPMSAAENASRQADAGVLLDSIFEHIQDDLLVPMLTQVYKNSLQFTPMEVWTEFITNRQDRFPLIKNELEALKAMAPDARYEMLASDLQFETKVFSAIFDKQAEIEKATFFMGVAGRIPMAMAHVQWGVFLRKLVENLGYDAEEIISDKPIVPYSELVGGKSAEQGPAAGGSDGGEAMPTQGQGAGQMTGQAGGMLGGMGEPNKAVMEAMPGGSM